MVTEIFAGGSFESEEWLAWQVAARIDSRTWTRVLKQAFSHVLHR